MSTGRRTFSIVLVLLTIAGLVVAGCGSSSSSSSGQASSGAQTQASSTAHTSFAKTKFVLHAGLAFGAFHRWIYKPLKAGSFTSGNPLKHKAAFVKAGLAGLFAYHELKLALNAAKSSPTLSKLLTPITALQSKLQSLGSSLKGGHLDPSAITSANSDIASLGSAAGASGQSITESVPSASQLLGGG
jgi:hypothetical protein